MRTVTLRHDNNFDEIPVRVRLGKPTERTNSEISTGIWVRDIWVGRKYVVVRYYSQWVRKDGTTSDFYELARPSDLRMIACEFSGETADKAAKILGVGTVDVDGNRVSP